MARIPDAPGCDWPRFICTQQPTERLPEGAAFCADHFKLWALEMHTLLAKYAS